MPEISQGIIEFFDSQKDHRQNVHIVMSSPLARHLAVKDGNYSEALENSFVNSTNIASIQPSEICQVASVGTVKSLPPPDSSSLYSSSLVNINLATNIMEALELCVADEYMIPINVVSAPARSRPAAKNNAFVCNFFGLCLWSHISDGVCWMTGSELQHTVKIKILHDTTELFRVTHVDLFKKLMTTKGFKLEPKKILSFYQNQRVSHREGRLFEKHEWLLTKIGFPFE